LNGSLLFFFLFIAPIESKLLLAGIELAVFNHLSEPKSAESVADAIGSHPGNTRLFLDSLAANDLIRASAALNFLKDNLDSFLTKIFDALNPNGIFITLSDGLTDERTKPELMVTGWLSMALTAQDMGFDQGIIAHSMFRVGFRLVRSRTLEMPMGPMDLDIGRK